MKAVTGSVMKELDRRAIDGGFVSGEELMERAGTLCAKEILRFVREALPENPGFLILAGKGNNGGDGFVIARILHETCPESDIRLVCAAAPEELKGDARTMFQRLPSSIFKSIRSEFDMDASRQGFLMIDAMLGTGVNGQVRAPFKEWIRLVNASGNPVVAVDLPSGLNADTGEVEDEAIIADLTVTLALPKMGLLSPSAQKICGRIRVADIGIPKTLLEELPDFTETTTLDDARSFFRREPGDTYKNRRGHLFVIGGSRDYPSAPFLTGEAALRAGCGLVTVVIPESVKPLSTIPKALIVRRLPDAGRGYFGKDSVPELLKLSEKADALVVGPGMSDMQSCGEFLKEFFLKKIQVPFLLDADALNLASKDPALFELFSEKRFIVTPHEGEMRRMLFALHVKEPISSSEKAKALSARIHSISVMKGPRSVITDSDGKQLCVNLSGCAALGTAGSGDVLSGIIGAFCAGGIEPFDAARFAVFLHGLTGEVLSPCGSRGILSDDLLNAIPMAWKKISVVL